MSAASVTGTFKDLPQNARISFNGRSLKVSYTPTTVTLTDTPPAITPAITPTITWPTPGPIVYGTAVSATAFYNGQPVSGTFTYVPTVLMAGLNQTLTVHFVPIDATKYNGTTASTEINVKSAPLTVVVNQASRSYGQPNPTFTVSYSGSCRPTARASSPVLWRSIQPQCPAATSARTQCRPAASLRELHDNV